MGHHDPGDEAVGHADTHPGRRISAALTDSDGLVQQAARDALAHLVETVPSVRSTVAQALRSKVATRCPVEDTGALEGPCLAGQRPDHRRKRARARTLWAMKGWRVVVQGLRRL